MTPEKKLTIKEKAKLYDNWLKFIKGRGWTEIMEEPQAIKEKYARLNKEIESHKGTGIMLSKENQNLKSKNTKLHVQIKNQKELFDALGIEGRTMLDQISQLKIANKMYEEENKKLKEDRDILLKERK